MLLRTGATGLRDPVKPITTNTMNDYNSAISACFQAMEDDLLARLLYGAPATGAPSNTPGSVLTVEAFIKASRLLEPPPDTREITVSPFVTRQYRFPRSKKRRIRDKWRKQPRNFKPAAYSTADAIYIHPDIYKTATTPAFTPTSPAPSSPRV